MSYTFQELLHKLKLVAVEDYRHEHYNHTVAFANWCKMIMTGDDQEDFLIEYKAGESGAQKKNRIKIYSSLTQFVSNRTMNVYEAVKRVDNVREVLEYNEEGDSSSYRKNQIYERLNNFFNKSNAKKYLHEAFQFYNFFDPNAFLVVEFENNDPIKKDIWTYPLEVTSKEAVDYERKNGELQYLTVMLPCKYKEKDGDEIKEKDGCKYTIYAADRAVRITELGEVGKAIVRDDIETITLKKEGGGKSVLFEYEEFETLSKVVPAIQFGYIRDPTTHRKTFVSPLYKAEKILKDLIISKSEYDLTKALHGFLQKYAYAEPCDFSVRPEGGASIKCRNGTMDDGSECPKCKGEGFKVHTTVQDIVLYELPRVGEGNGIPLKDMVHYVQIPQHLIEAHQKDMEELEKKVSKSVFNTNVFDRQEIAVTATEKRLELDSVYNVLSEYADHFSELYKHIVKLTAIHLKNDNNLVLEYQFPHDFKMESVNELLLLRSDAIKSGAPMDVVYKIDLALIEKQYSDDPKTIARMEARLNWKPFYDKSENEIMFVLSTMNDDDFEKVLWTYYDRIMTEIENTEIPIETESGRINKKFHELDYADQKGIIDKKVSTYQEVIRDRIEANRPRAFSEIN